MEEQLKTIYKKFINAQSVGIDGTTKAQFDANLAKELATITRKFSNQTYEFSYYKQLLKIKSHNQTRVLSIPTIRDKIVINYLNDSLKQAFQSSLKNLRTPHAMIDEIKKSRNAYTCFLKVDIQDFYPSIDHNLLLDKLHTPLQESPYILELIAKATKQTTVPSNLPAKERIKYASTVGVPQGLSMSATLAQIYLFDIDKKYQKNKSIKYYRYVDDVLILCQEADVAKLQKALERDFKKLKLTIHKYDASGTKSSFGSMGEPFEFLGYRFQNGIVSVRNRSYARMYDNLNALFTQYKEGAFTTKHAFYKKLNLKITGCIIDNKRYGWIHFFSMMDDHKLLFNLDRFIQKACIKLELDSTKVKKYTRAIYEIKDLQSPYIETIINYKKAKQKEMLRELENDVEYY